MNDRSSISRIWLGFEDSGATTPSAPNTYRGSISWCLRTYLVPDCRPNQKRSYVSSTGSVIPADRRGADRGNRITMDSSKRKGPGCRTNQIDGLVDFVLRCLNGSRNRCRSVDTGREHRRRIVPVMIRVSCIPSRLLSYCLKKPLCIERAPPFQHGVYSASEFLGEDRQGLGFAIPADQSLVIELSPFIFPEKQAGCFAEGPFQMDISDFVVGSLHTFSCRFMRALHQSSV